MELQENKNFIGERDETNIITNDLRLKQDNNKPKNRENPFLYLCTLTTAILSFSSGVSLSWTSPVLPRVNTLESPFYEEITLTQKAWIASCLPLGAAIGPPIAGICSDIFGKKKVLLGIAMPMIVGYSVLAGAHKVELYYFARFIIGLSVGSTFAIVPIYLQEVTQSFNRGKLGCFVGLAISLGINYSFSIGPHLNTTLYALSCALPLLIFVLIFMIFMPETPYDLVKIGDFTAAKKVLRKLRPSADINVEKELLQIHETVSASIKHKANLRELFGSKISRKALFIAIGTLSIHQLAGINPLLAYMKTIFEASGTKIHPNICTSIIGVVEICSHILCIVVVENLRTRTILMISCLGCSVSIGALGTYFYLKTHNCNVDSIYWLPVSSLVVYNVFFGISLGPLPYAIVGALFPMHVKGLSAAFCATSSFAISSLVTFSFPVISQFIGMYGVFWIFSVNCILGLLFIYFMLPETQGKSLAQIQQVLKKMVE